MHKEIYQDSEMRVTLSYYYGEKQMRPHAHDVHQISFLLSGELLETNGNRQQEMVQPSFGVKPAGLIHENIYGRDGALILTINLIDSYKLEQITPNLNDWLWIAKSKCANQKHLKFLIQQLISGVGSGQQALIWELISSLMAESKQPSAKAPVWLQNVREELRDDTQACITQIASQQGVHPVYLSRIFSQHFGCPPTLFKSYYRFSRALEALSKGLSLSAAAANAGYADQSHFTRHSRQLSGLTPRQFRQLLV